MSSPKMMLLLLVLCFSVSGTFCARKDGVYGDGVNSPSGCQNCSICPYPCRPQPPPPPPPSGYPSPGAPPPPVAVTGNCPPAPPACCQNPQYSPPSPPSAYSYVPYNDYSASSPTPLSAKSSLSIFLTNVFLFGFVSLYLV